MVNSLTQRHRAQQLLLRRATQSQVERLWPSLDWEQLDESYPAFAVGMAKLVESNRQVSAGLAATYVRTFRASHHVTGNFQILTAPLLNVDQFSASLHTTSVAALKRSSAEGVARDVAMAHALTETRGAMARLVLNAGRDTVLKTGEADPRAFGWQRVLGGAGCDFCREQAGRGSVYFSEDTAGFEPHDHCGCTPELVYD